MTLRKQPNKWSCTLYALAMCLDAEPKKLISEIGHDGSQILWPESRLRHRGYHIQELYGPCLERGVAPIFWEANMVSAPALSDVPNVVPYDLMSRIKSSNLGIVFHDNHAWAWDGIQLYNPSGIIETVERSNIVTKYARYFLQLISAIKSVN